MQRVLAGVTIAGVHSYGKGRASVGLVTAIWVARAEVGSFSRRAIVCSFAIRRSYKATIVSLALHWKTIQDYNPQHFFILLFLLFKDFIRSH